MNVAIIQKRGAKPRRSSPVVWSSSLAYVVGILTTDGCLSKDGRHIILVSKDREQLQNVMKALRLEVAIGTTRSGYTRKATTRIQFGDVVLYRFLLGVGLMPNKTKIIGVLNIPDQYFFDFLRGHFDGDGSSYSYWDSRWRSSFMFYTTFVSASLDHITWLRERIRSLLGIQGHVSHDGRRITFQLKYAKKESLLLIPKLYPSKNVVCLTRKRLKIERALRIITTQSSNS